MPEALPYIPQYITVHLGAPNEAVSNVTVTFPDYIKNVASSEIYPTWEESSLRANILAQVSFALNRVYTNFYRLQNYDFDITSSTAYDQKFINNRNIFSNIDRLVDEIFNTYIRRIGFIEPLAAKFCNGTTVTCDGLSQWGSQSLAEDGFNSIQILRYYYGDNIELVSTAQIRNISTQYPGYPVSRGDSSGFVIIIQNELNRISQNYPAIPKIYPVDGIFGENTENAVRMFQSIFNLTPDGIVGEATWNRLAFLYTGVRRLSELESEGITVYRASLNYPGANIRVESPENTSSLQYMLLIISEFDDFIPAVNITGILDEQTKDAITAFQEEYKLPVTGTINGETWDLIYRVFIPIYEMILSDNELFPVSTVPFDGKDCTLRSSGDEVKTVQEYINCIFNERYGIRPIGITGIFGRQTQQAVMRYQRDNNLPATGVVNGNTYRSIENSYKNVMSSTTSRLRQYPGFTLQEGDTDNNIRGNNND